MALGQLVADLLYVAGLLLLLTVSSVAGTQCWDVLVRAGVPSWMAFAPAVLAGMVAWVMTVGVLHLPLRRMPAGRHAMMKSAGFYAWFFSYLVRRYLAFPPLLTFVLQSHVLRFVFLRMLGARVHFTTTMSGDVLVLDPALFRAGPGCVVGSGAMVAGHLVANGRLILAPVTLGARVEVGARAGISPGVVVEDGTRLGVGVNLGPSVHVGKNCVLDHHVTVDAHCTIGEGARILACTYVPPGTEIPANAIWSQADSDRE